jgi:hypothetical protein
MLITGVASYAQSVDVARASIPFEFTVNGASFPAGSYSVVSTSNPRIAILRNQENPHLSTIVILRSGETLADGKAEFVVKRKSAPEQAGNQGVR